MTCSKCNKEFTDGIGSLCRRCYNREWESKHPHRKKISTVKCSLCESPMKAKGFCEKHYMRFLRHGHTDDTRPNTWGTIEKHPLKNVWSWMHRSNTGDVCDRWKCGFRDFLNDVGERPSKKHYLKQIDPEQPYSPTNFIWVDKSKNGKKF
jgi:hypothetical protein